MSIKTVGNFNKMLENFETNSWAKTKDLSNTTKLTTNELAQNPLEVVKDKKSFSDMLAQSLGEVNGLQQEANKAIQKLATGQSKNIHETMLAVERAEIAFKTMNQIRSKVIDAYKEVMRMQV